MLRILKDKNLPTTSAEEVKEITPELKMLAAEMMATMVMNKGIGLAAPQVGKNIRLIVFDCTNLTYKASDSGFMFNPKIIESSELKNSRNEGCLSFPGQWVTLARNSEIKVEYLDLSGKTVVKEYINIAARVIQHEIDHLNGITMYDRSKINDTDPTSTS